MVDSLLINRRTLLASSLGVIASTVAPSAVAEAEWPKGAPLKLLVPFSAGSAVDSVARLIGPELGKLLDTTVIVDNRPGAGGSIGTTALVRGPADGYTVMVQSSALVINPSFIHDLPYNTLKDISGVGLVGVTSFVMVAPPSKGYKGVKDLIARAAASPDALNYGSGGVGSGSHLASAKLVAATGVAVHHIPSRGTLEALTETMAGRLDWVFAPAPAALTLIKAGRLQAIAVSSSARAAALPDVPSMVEAGFPNAAYSPWIGAFVSSKTPRPIVDRLSQALLQVITNPAVKERLAQLGLEPTPMSPARFDKLITDDLEAMTNLVKVAKIKIAE